VELTHVCLGVVLSTETALPREAGDGVATREQGDDDTDDDEDDHELNERETRLGVVHWSVLSNPGGDLVTGVVKLCNVSVISHGEDSVTTKALAELLVQALRRSR